MKNTLTILREAEEIGVSIAQIEGENATAARKVEEIEKALAEAVSAQQSVEDRLGKEKEGYEQFLKSLPDTLPADKVRKITQDRVAQLIDEGLLEGIDASAAEPEVPAAAPASETPKATSDKTDKAADEAEASKDAGAEPEDKTDEGEAQGGDLLQIDMTAVGDEETPKDPKDEVIALVDKEKAAPKRGQAKVATPEFVDQ